MISTKNLFWEEIFPLFKLAGNGSSNFLHGQTSCDVHGLKSENLIRTCWLSPTGRLKALLEIRFVKKDIEFIILGGNIEELLDGFKKVIFPSDCVEVEPVGEIKRLHEISYTKSWKTSTCKWLPIQNLADNSLDVYKLASKQEIEEWRIRQGIPIGLKELNGENNPFEVGLSDFVGLNKGCYLGQETMAKLKTNMQLKQELRFFTITGNLGENANHAGSTLETESKDKAGHITSFMSLENELHIGLALIRKKYLTKKNLFLSKRSISIETTIPIGFSGIES